MYWGGGGTGRGWLRTTTKIPLSDAWDYSVLTPRQLAELDMWANFYKEHSKILFVGNLDYHSRIVAKDEKRKDGRVISVKS